MKQLWVFLLMISLVASLQSEVKVRRKHQGRIVVTNALRRPAATIKSKVGKTPEADSVTHTYASQIRALALRYDVREDLIRAVARAESDFNPYAVSKKGAVGIMQLMPETARRYGVNNRFNISENLKAGVRHLKYLNRRFNGKLSLILAAYNAGENAVLQHNGVPPYRETREYVRRAMGFMGLSYRGSSLRRSTLYKVITPQGRILITNSAPPRGSGKVEVLK